MVAITCGSLSDPKKLNDLLITSLTQEPTSKINSDRTFKSLDSLFKGNSKTSMRNLEFTKKKQCGFVGIKVPNAVRNCLNEVNQSQSQPNIDFEGLGSADILTKFSGVHSNPSAEMLTLGDKVSGSFHAFSSTDGLVYKFEKAYLLKDGKIRFRLNQTDYNYFENYSATTDSYLKGAYPGQPNPSQSFNNQIKEYQVPKKQGSLIGIDGYKKFRDLLELKLNEKFKMLLTSANQLLPTVKEEREVQICLTHRSVTYVGFKNTG